MKILIDNQLPIALASFFRSKGVECKHVLEVGLDKSTDRQIWDFAESQQFVIVSKDEDFLHLAKQHPSKVQVVWVRIGNCRTAALLSVFEKLWSTIEQALLANEDVIELR